MKEKHELNENEILYIHSLVLIDRPDCKGKYRNVPVRILGTNAKTKEPYLIKTSMENLINWYKNERELSFIEKVALFHLKFETIHPFLDGNGRCGRLILNFELMKNGYVPINIKYKDRRKYYDAFKSYNETNDIVPMSSLICDYLIEEMTKYINMKEN